MSCRREVRAGEHLASCEPHDCGPSAVEAHQGGIIVSCAGKGEQTKYQQMSSTKGYCKQSTIYAASKRESGLNHVFYSPYFLPGLETSKKHLQTSGYDRQAFVFAQTDFRYRSFSVAFPTLSRSKFWPLLLFVIYSEWEVILNYLRRFQIPTPFFKWLNKELQLYEDCSDVINYIN